MILEANLYSLLSFAWTLAPQIICDKILFSHTRRWFEFLFLYFFLFRFFCYFTVFINFSGMFRNVPCSWFYRRPWNIGFKYKYLLDYKWKPIISYFQRFFSKSYSNWRITKGWKTSDNLFLNTVNRAHSKVIYDNLVRMVKNSTSLGRFPGIDLWYFLATSLRTGGISNLASLNKRVTR